jgi:hypothetical protein
VVILGYEFFKLVDEFECFGGDAFEILLGWSKQVLEMETDVLYVTYEVLGYYLLRLHFLFRMVDN